jgi:predicted nucleic acid-binding protein
MSDIVVDSSVAAKWILTEPDSPEAEELFNKTRASGDRLFVLDLVSCEVANAVWKQQRQRHISVDEAEYLLNEFMKLPLEIELAARVLMGGLEIAIKYDRPIYDALFVALTRDKGLRGVTADVPLNNATHNYPQIVLLRNL